MSVNGRMMIVQNVYGAGADYLVMSEDDRHAHTMIRIDHRAAELSAYFDHQPINLTGLTEAHLVASVNAVLATCPGHWEVDGSAPMMTPGSCLDPTWPRWKPCGDRTPDGKIITGRVFLLHRKPDPVSPAEAINVRSELDNPAPLRVFMTQYCAFVQFAQ